MCNWNDTPFERYCYWNTQILSWRKFISERHRLVNVRILVAAYVVYVNVFLSVIIYLTTCSWTFVTCSHSRAGKITWGFSRYNIALKTHQPGANSNNTRTRKLRVSKRSLWSGCCASSPIDVFSAAENTTILAHSYTYISHFKRILEAERTMLERNTTWKILLQMDMKL